MRGRHRRLRWLMATAVFWAWASGVEALAQGARITLPTFEALAREAKQTVDVTLDDGLLQLAGSFVDHGEVKDLLRDLKGIYVRSFEFDRPNAFSNGDVDAVRKQLVQGNWSRIVSVQKADEGELSEVYAWLDQNAPGGIAILSTSPRSFTVVNIVGRVDLAKLRRLEGTFGIPRVTVPHEKQP